MKFLIAGYEKALDIGILSKLAELEWNGTPEDRERYFNIAEDKEGYEYIIELTQCKIDNYVEVHTNMVLTENGAYYVVIDYKNEVPPQMANKKLYFLSNGKLVHEYAEKMDLKTPVLKFIPVAPYYDNDKDHKKLEKIGYKFDLTKIDLRNLFLFKSVIYENFAIIETQSNVFCISLKGNSRVQDLKGFRLYGKIRDRPLLITTQGKLNFLIELSDTLKLIKIIKE